jgi:hypothetical protein
VSGFSPFTLSFLGLVFVVALCVSILAVRRDHTDNAHTLWYVFSLTLCSVSVLFFYIYEKSRAIQSTPLGGNGWKDPSHVHEGFDGCSGGDIHPSDSRRVAHTAANTQLSH